MSGGDKEGEMTWGGRGGGGGEARDATQDAGARWGTVRWASLVCVCEKRIGWRWCSPPLSVSPCLSLLFPLRFILSISFSFFPSLPICLRLYLSLFPPLPLPLYPFLSSSSSCSYTPCPNPPFTTMPNHIHFISD